MKTKLQALMAVVNKAIPGAMGMANTVQSGVLRRIPSGIFGVDVAIGGGIPRGRVTMIVGGESTGKTTLCLYIIATWQHTCRECLTPFRTERITDVDKDGVVTRIRRPVTQKCACGKCEPHMVAYYDAEGTMDVPWAEGIGVDTDSLLLIQPEGAEQGVDIMSKALRTGELDLAIVDSIAMMTPRREIEQSAEAGQRPDMALITNRAMRVWQAALNSLGLENEQKPAIILVNQFREKVGVMYGPTETWPGGKGQNFAASIMLHMRAGKRIDGKGVPGGKDPSKVGVQIHFKVPKNKTATPYREGTFNLYTQTAPQLGVQAGEVDNFQQVIEYGAACGALERRGAWYVLQDAFGKAYANPENKNGNFQGLDSVVAFLKAHPELADAVTTAIRAHVHTGMAPVPSTEEDDT